MLQYMHFLTFFSVFAAEIVFPGANSSQVSMLELSSKAEGVADFFKGQQSGEGTYYGANGDSAGACEDHRVNGRALWGHNAITVAINSQQWFNGRSCGTCLEVTSAKMGLNKAFAIVNNLCPECHKGDLDFATNGDGRWNDLRWKAVPCKGSFFSKFAFIMQGSNQWYLKVAVKRSKYPVTGMEVKAGGRWISPQSTEGSYFVFTGQQLSFPLPVRIKSAAKPGEQVLDTISRMANEQLIEGSAQFSGGGGGGGGGDDDDEDDGDNGGGGGGDDVELWPKLYNKKKCEKPGNEPIKNVQSRSECEGIAKSKGRSYYSYLWDQKKCFTSDTCDSPKTTTWEWAVFEEPVHNAVTPKPTPEATPPPTPAESRGMCQPWCHKHEIKKWGKSGTDSPGAKCSWKRCGGCEPCGVQTVEGPLAVSASFSFDDVPSKGRKLRKARKALKDAKKALKEARKM